MPLSHYGSPVCSYDGRGTLHLHSGTPVACSFEAGQLSNGDVLLLSGTPSDVWSTDAADRFTGQTADGRTIDAELDLTINVLGTDSGVPLGTYFAHCVVKLRAQLATSRPVASHRYSLVNLRFFGTSPFTEHNVSGQPVRHAWHLDLRLPDPRGEIAVHIEPLHDYSRVATEIATTRGIAVTSEAVVDTAMLPSGVDADAMMDDLCLLLSVARGTRVQWIYRREFDSSGQEIGATHISHITRRFQGLEPLDHRPQGCADTKRFLEGAYAALPEATRNYELRRALVPAYTDARSEDDALEMRGVKLAVVSEMIKAQHGGAGAVPIARPWTSAWLRSWPRLWRQRRYRKFGTALRDACRAAGYRPSKSVINDFVACRNRLIHAGRFRSDPAAPDPRCRFADAASEYMFMLSFVDRFFLHLLRYKGPFIDWAKYPQHEEGRIG